MAAVLGCDAVFGGFAGDVEGEDAVVVVVVGGEQLVVAVGVVVAPVGGGAEAAGRVEDVAAGGLGAEAYVDGWGVGLEAVGGVERDGVRFAGMGRGVG